MDYEDIIPKANYFRLKCFDSIFFYYMMIMSTKDIVIKNIKYISNDI
ncbi:hypothetical protein [Clostridium felsineum]|nr:hypothetical protein [Clostridium felsineum]